MILVSIIRLGNFVVLVFLMLVFSWLLIISVVWKLFWVIVLVIKVGVGLFVIWGFMLVVVCSVVIMDLLLGSRFCLVGKVGLMLVVIYRVFVWMVSVVLVRLDYLVVIERFCMMVLG